MLKFQISLKNEFYLTFFLMLALACHITFTHLFMYFNFSLSFHSNFSTALIYFDDMRYMFETHQYHQ